VKATTQLVGLIGWPLEHSVSPAMHNSAFDAMGLDWCYVPLPVAPGQVESAVKGLAALGFRGANVTVPHKQAVIPHLDGVSNAVQEIGAVNTIALQKGQLVGHNTDAEGFLIALREAGFEPAGLRAVVVGAGGAARAVAHSLLHSGAGEILVLSRTLSRAQVLTEELGSLTTHACRLQALALSPGSLVESARDADLLIHATPAGTWPHVAESVWPHGVPIPAHLVVFDLVYNPPETRLLEQAREAGAHPVGGLDMLVGQAILAFEIWTGQRPSPSVMRSAAQRELERRHQAS
jgi:shikimate dehydrogenase